MENKNLPSYRQKSFEELKKINNYGAEYWSARDLQPLLGYNQWRRFEDAVKRAIISCEQSGNTPDHHFAGAGKMISLGKGAIQKVLDYHLSRLFPYPPARLHPHVFGGCPRAGGDPVFVVFPVPERYLT